VRRHKTAFTAVAAVAAALVVGLGLSLYLFIREKDARKRAVEAEKEQGRLRLQAEGALAAEAKLREQAERGKKYAEAGLLLSQRKFAEAERVVNEAPPHPAAASIFSVLGMVHMTRAEWRPAITNYTKVIHLMPTDHYAYHYIGPLLLQTGDVEGYRQHCQEMLRQFGATTDPTIAERTAKDCLILPTDDFTVIGKLVEVAVAAGPDHKFWPSIQFAKGLAEFRQGHSVEAVKWLESALKSQGDIYRTVQAYATLAMSQWRLKQTETARATFAKGTEFAENRLPRMDKDINPEDRWNDWFIAHALLREAKAMIEAGSNPR
jgi:eukaryotic-like serine/threonine-protein kinase